MDTSEEVGNADIEQESKSEFAKYVVSQILNSHIDTNGEKNEETWDEYWYGIENVDTFCFFHCFTKINTNKIRSFDIITFFTIKGISKSYAVLTGVKGDIISIL